MKGGKLLNSGVAMVMAAAVIASNICLFKVVTDYYPVFWISFGFSMTACVLSIVLLLCDVGIGSKKQIYAYVLYPTITYYLVFQLIAGILCSLLLKKFVLIAFVIQLFILMVFLVIYMGQRKANASSRRHQAQREQEMSRFRSILDAGEGALKKVDYSASYRKSVQKAMDAISSGQVKSSPAAGEVEDRLLRAISDLSAAIDSKDEANILELCKTIELLCDERNRVLRN